jgi:hypothetical protein
MRFVTDRIRTACLTELRQGLERVALFGEGLEVLTDDEVRLLRRLAYRLGAERGRKAVRCGEWAPEERS